jgi:protein tyrosine/serine phosphatase
MKRQFLLLIASLLPLVALSAQTKPQAAAPPTMQSAYGERLRTPGLPHLGKINDYLYRGAQPQEQGLPELKHLGITTIIDLRSEDLERVERERKQAESLGMHFVHIPIGGFAPPTNEQVIQFLSILRQNPREKVFVHCLFGDDRTGVMVATYRMAFEKWPYEQAMKEMYFFGFNGFWHPAMKSFIRDFPARLSSAPAFASFQNEKSPVPTATAN